MVQACIVFIVLSPKLERVAFICVLLVLEYIIYIVLKILIELLYQ